MADDRRKGLRDRNGSISAGRQRRRSKRQHTVDRCRHAVVDVRRDTQGQGAAVAASAPNCPSSTAKAEEAGGSRATCLPNWSTTSVEYDLSPMAGADGESQIGPRGDAGARAGRRLRLLRTCVSADVDGARRRQRGAYQRQRPGICRDLLHLRSRQTSAQVNATDRNQGPNGRIPR